MHGTVTAGGRALAFEGIGEATRRNVSSKPAQGLALTRELEGVANGITEEAFTYWRQNPGLRVTIQMSSGNPDDPAPLNRGPVRRKSFSSSSSGELKRPERNPRPSGE